MTKRWINIDAWHHWYWVDDPLPAEPLSQGDVSWNGVEEAIRGAGLFNRIKAKEQKYEERNSTSSEGQAGT